MNTETTEAQEKEQVLSIAQTAMASITNVPEYKKTLTDLVDKHKNAAFKNLEDKEGIKSIQTAYSETRQARLAVDKLGKNFKGLMKQIIEHGEGQIDELLEIVSPEEKRFKSEKDKIDDLKQEAEDERLRQLEEKKQARIAKLFELGLKFNGAYYEIADLNIMPIQVTQYTEAQFEGFIAQATVAYEAEQLRIAEEKEAEEKRIAEEKKAREEAEEAQRKAQELLAKENAAKQAELEAARKKQEEQDALIAELQAKLKSQEPQKPAEPAIIPSADIKPVETPKNGSAIKFTEGQRESILHDVLVAEEAVKQDEEFKTISATLNFSTSHPYLDTKIGNSIFRVYPEGFLDIVNTSVPEGMEAKKSGDFGKDMLYLVLTPIK